MRVCVIIFLLYIVKSVQGLRCMTCSSAQSFDECDASGDIILCLPNENSCQTNVRRYKDKLLVWKGCKEKMACQNNQAQNFLSRPSQCNLGQTSSMCTCCCEESMCNVGASCMKEFHHRDPERECSQEPTNFAHGTVQCSDGHNAGSVCEYRCHEKDYSIWPKDQQNNLCLSNGSWARDTPCCARPCPPYFLADNAMLLYYAGNTAEKLMQSFIESVTYGRIAEDALKISILSFGRNPVESSLIKFNDYGGNETRFGELVRERLVLAEGSPRFGVAMQFALERMLTTEAGMRDHRVMKTLELHTNVQPGDDAIEMGKRARELGFLVYVLGFEREGFEFNREQLVEITGDEEHVFLLKNLYGNLSPESVADLIKHFCFSSCDHVLHDHE